MQRLFLSRNIETPRTRVGGWALQQALGGSTAPGTLSALGGALSFADPAAAAVSHSCACIGSPCLRHCVHGAPIGGGIAMAAAGGRPRLQCGSEGLRSGCGLPVQRAPGLAQRWHGELNQQRWNGGGGGGSGACVRS
jgi:hypothetical protein